jgi:hypothetical protein
VNDEPASDESRVPLDRRFRNLYLFSSVFTAYGWFAVGASLAGPLAWKGVALGLSSLLSAWAFWSRVTAQEGSATFRLREREYYAVTASVVLFVLGVVGDHFKIDLLLFLVMPISFAWYAFRHSPSSIQSENHLGSE